MTQSRQQYIDNYAEYAMEQMRRYGIPASITLAQGIIESADGKSTLANTANNHFGVKGSFNGNYVLADDDKPNEKFKKYDNVGQSYEDHSKVLTNQRYQRYVKNLAPDDYKGWASGIQKGGYASSKAYVSTVVNVIEGCGLQKYDKMVMNQMKNEGKQFWVASNPLTTGTTEKKVETKNTGMSLSKGQYCMPVKREEFLLVTSPYGKREDPIQKVKTQIHHCIDIKTHNESVLATENGGKVIGVDNRTNTGGGKTLTIEYERPDGSKTQVQYMHLLRIDVKKGDTVNIDYVGKKDGVAFEGGTAQGHDLEIGSGAFIDGFEDGLIGVETGKTIDLNLTFPENYTTADLAGAKVVFTVTVNYIRGAAFYTDKDLQEAKEIVVCNDLYTSIMNQSEYRNIPAAAHDYYYNMVISYYGSTASGVTEYAEQYAQRQGKFIVLVRALADEFKLTVTDQDYAGMLNSLAAEYNTTPAKFEEENGKAFLRFQALSELVQEDLYKRYEATLEK